MKPNSFSRIALARKWMGTGTRSLARRSGADIPYPTKIIFNLNGSYAATIYYKGLPKISIDKVKKNLA